MGPVSVECKSVCVNYCPFFGVASPWDEIIYLEASQYFSGYLPVNIPSRFSCITLGKYLWSLPCGGEGDSCSDLLGHKTCYKSAAALFRGTP